MKESPYPLEQALGMEYYTTNTPGIGGVLRSSPEDFKVEELSYPPGSEGRYLVCRLIKKDWELQKLVKQIARALGISHRRITWAGTKDKRGVTTQLVTIHDVDPAMLSKVYIKDVSLELVGRSRIPLSLGNLRGNVFSIWIRDCVPDLLVERVNTVAENVRLGILNYYGVQRFGVTRPITHVVGEAILRDEYERATLAYIAESSVSEPEETQAARRQFLEHRDPKIALRKFPVHLSYERAMLHHLSTTGGDYENALRTLPPKLLSLLVSAFQSYIFNSALSQRCSEEIPLHEPRAGDHLLFDDGKADVVTPSSCRAARLHLERNRARIALFIPGAMPDEWRHASPWVLHLLDEHNITPAHFQKAQEFVHTAFHGFYRPICLKTTISVCTKGTDAHLNFSLGPGQYATTVCREFMKSDPRTLI